VENEKKERDFYRKKAAENEGDILAKAKKLKEDSYSLGTDGIQDMADAASNTYTADILMSISDNDLRLLKDIDNTLDKMEKGPMEYVKNVKKKLARKDLKQIL